VIVSSADDVRAWASRHGVTSIDDPASLDRAAAAGASWCADQGLVRAIVAHADLPRAPVGGLIPLAADASIPIATVIPCHRDDGTPVLSIPIATRFSFSYGPGSFRRHLASARKAGLAVRVVRDAALGFDVDVPDDLAALTTTP
jgi:2-phospho-L-lactate guanylyltransferase